MKICTALCCAAQLCARTNMIRLLSVLQKKAGVCVHLVGTEIDWFLESGIAIFRRKILKKKKRKIPRKHHHFVTPLFKSRDDVFVESCAFFKIFWRKKFKKKTQVPWKRRHWVIPLFKIKDIPLLNNSVTQWRHFHRILGFVFRMFAHKKWNWLAHQWTPIFLVPTSAVLHYSALFSAVCFGSALYGATLHGW